MTLYLHLAIPNVSIKLRNQSILSFLKQAAPKPEASKGDGAIGESAEEQAAKEEADARSVYVGNVDYECTPEELQLHFQVHNGQIP